MLPAVRSKNKETSSAAAAAVDAFVFSLNNRTQAAAATQQPPPTLRSYSLMSQTATNGTGGGGKREYERFFSDMELEFGPGIVDRLKSKFASASSSSSSASLPALGQQQHTYAPIIGQGAGREFLYTASPPLTKPSLSDNSTTSVASRKLDGILQQKILMNDNVIIIDRGGMAATSASNSTYAGPPPPPPPPLPPTGTSTGSSAASAASPAVKLTNGTGHSNASYKNTLAAALVNKSECIEGLVSQYKAIFDAKEPVPAQRRKRHNSGTTNTPKQQQSVSLGGSPTDIPFSPSAAMTIAPTAASVGNPAPVAPPRPKRWQTSLKGQKISPIDRRAPQDRVTHGPLTPAPPAVPPAAVPPVVLPVDVGLPKFAPLDYTDYEEIYCQLASKEDDSSVEKVDSAPVIPSRASVIPPPRPPGPPSRGEKLLRPAAVLPPLPPPPRPKPNEVLLSQPEKIPAVVETISEEKKEFPRPASFDYTALTGSRLGSATPVFPTADVEKSAVASEALSVGTIEKVSKPLGASRPGVEGATAPAGNKPPPRPPGRFSLDAGRGSLLDASKMGVDKLEEEEKPKLTVLSFVKEEVTATDSGSVKAVEMVALVIPEKIDFKERISPEPATKLLAREKLSQLKKSTSLDKPLPTELLLDSEKENTTPCRVVLKKTTGYGMTTIIDTSRKPIDPSSPALKIDDPAQLTSLRDIGRARPPGSANSSASGGVDALLEVETLKMIVLGHNSPTGSRSSLKSAGNSRSNLRITFNDSATKTHEYPSERSLIGAGGLDTGVLTSTSVLMLGEHIDESDTDGLSATSDSPVPTREGDLLRKPSALSRPSLSSGLSSYKPSSVGQFQLGMERPTFPSDTAVVTSPTSPTVTSQSEATGARPLLPLHQRQPTGNNKTPYQHDTDRRDQWCVQSSADEGNFSNTTSDADDLLF